MRPFGMLSKDVRDRIWNISIMLLLIVSTLAGIFILFTLSMRILSSAENTTHPSLLTWWVNTKHGQALKIRLMPTRHTFERKPYGYDRSWLDPTDYNYTLTISERAQWPQPDFQAKYRSLLNEVRNERFVHRRSHIQDFGTRVTCWPSGKLWGYDGGFYSRRVSAVELDWLGLPRFQDTLRSQDQVAEDLFCEKFKRLLPFSYKNSTWYHEIVKLDEKHTHSQLLGCEPGFRRTIEGGVVTDIETVECYNRSPHAFVQKDGDQEILWYLEQPMWALDDWQDWGSIIGASKWAAGGRIRNALTMEERIKAIELSGGKRLVGEELKNFWGCWYGEFMMDCSEPGKFAGYEDWDLDNKEVWLY